MFKKMSMQLTILTITLFTHTALSIDSKKIDNDASRSNNDSFWQDCSVPEDCSLKEKLTTHSMLNCLIENVEFLQDHEQDYIELFQEDITEVTLCSINKNLEAYKKILSFLNRLKSKEITIETVLMEMLIIRTSFIKSRRTNTEIYEKAKRNPTSLQILYGPTDPAIYDSLPSEQQVLAQKATDHYQMYNRVIIGLLSCLDSHSLPPNIKGCLRANPTLCSIIMSGTKNLGHPDETFDLSGKGMSDWEYYETHIYASEPIKITVFSTCYKEDKLATVTPYVRKIYEPNWLHPYAHVDLPYPDFLKPTSALEVSRIRTERSSLSQISLPFQAVDGTNPSDINKTIKKKKKKKKKKEKKTKKKNMMSMMSKKNEKAILTSQAPTCISDSTQKLDLQADNSVTKMETSPQASFDTVVTEDLATQATIVPLTGLQGLLPEPREEPITAVFEKDTVPQMRPIISLTTSTANYLPPRGMRLFHSNQSITTQIPLMDLKGKQLKTLGKIFAKSYSPVKYGKIASLWRHINGLNSIDVSGGTSHKELLDKNGNVIMGIFAHNDNTTYGTRTIKYIRDAFTRIGYGSNYF